jgi:hypothetical protein
MTRVKIWHDKLRDDKKTNVAYGYKNRRSYLEKEEEKEQNKIISSIGQMAEICLGFFSYYLMVNQIQSLVRSSGVPILY